MDGWIRYLMVEYQCSHGVFQIRNEASGNCVDAAVGEDADNKPVSPYPCHDQGGNQVTNGMN